jgi:midasin
MRQLSRAIKLACRVLSNEFVSCEIWKAIYVGLRVAFHSELNTKSQNLFNSIFEEIFEVKDIVSKYMKSNFFFFKFHNYSMEQIMHLESTDLGLLISDKKMMKNTCSPQEIEFVYLNDTNCISNILNHPVKIQMNSDIRNKIKEKKIQVENQSKIINKQNIFAIESEKPNLVTKTKTPYIITEKLKSNILDLLKLISFSEKLPVLLEGPTSTGKTSVVMFLANLLGQKVFRVNNHKDTDLEEYIGSFKPSVEKGGLKFSYGVLSRAMKEGSWVLLDELNLAKSEILEALNRLVVIYILII